MAAPSPFRDSTLRSGQATAAPMESGIAWPMAPPVSASTSCGAAVFVWLATPPPEVTESSQMMAPSGRWRAMEAPAAWGVIGPVGGAAGRFSGWTGPALGAPSASASARRPSMASSLRAASVIRSHPSGTSRLGRSG